MVYNTRRFTSLSLLTRLLRVILAGVSLASVLAALGILGIRLRRTAVLVRQLVPDGFEESFVFVAVASRLGR
jgi:hypothetical protein